MHLHRRARAAASRLWSNLIIKGERSNALLRARVKNARRRWCETQAKTDVRCKYQGPEGAVILTPREMGIETRIQMTPALREGE